MKAILAICLIVAFASAQSSVMQQAQEILNKNPCYQQNIMNNVVALSENMMKIQQTQDISLLENAITQAA